MNWCSLIGHRWRSRALYAPCVCTRCGTKVRTDSLLDAALDFFWRKGQCSQCLRWTCRKIGPWHSRRREAAFCDECLNALGTYHQRGGR